MTTDQLKRMTDADLVLEWEAYAPERGNVDAQNADYAVCAEIKRRGLTKAQIAGLRRTSGPRLASYGPKDAR